MAEALLHATSIDSARHTRLPTFSHVLPGAIDGRMTVGSTGSDQVTDAHRQDSASIQPDHNDEDDREGSERYLSAPRSLA